MFPNYCNAMGPVGWVTTVVVWTTLVALAVWGIDRLFPRSSLRLFPRSSLRRGGGQGDGEGGAGAGPVAVGGDPAAVGVHQGADHGQADA